MRYMGSKARFAKEMLPVILKDRVSDQWYVEPFVGGFNMIDKVPGARIANDINPYITALYKALLDGWVPPEYISDSEYAAVKAAPDKYPDFFVGFVGFGCSFSGKFWGGYARGGYTAKGNPRNHCRESRDNLLKQVTGLKGVVIVQGPYNDFTIPPCSIVYCDPPYEETTGYRIKFDHLAFWQWVRELHLAGHRVFVSEYKAPDDFKCVWQKEVKSSIVITGQYKSREGLFTPR